LADFAVTLHFIYRRLRWRSRSTKAR